MNILHTIKFNLIFQTGFLIKKGKKTIQLQLISSNKPFFSKEKINKTDDFQRWISRLVYR